MLPVRLRDLHVSRRQPLRSLLATPPHSLTNPPATLHRLPHSYDLYLEDLEHHHTLLSQAKQQLLALERTRAQRVPDALWPPEFGPRSAEPADPETVKDQAKKELEDARAALPPSMRAFLEMEERMKERQKAVKA